MFPQGQHPPARHGEVPAALPGAVHLPWTDLTRTVRTGMPVYPGDPAVRISPALRLAEDGVEVAHLRLGSHTGTHVDAPAHTVSGGRTVDRLRLDELVGDALVLGFEGLPADAVITAGMVAALVGDDAARVPERVLVATGWDRVFHDPEQSLHHPVLTAEAAEVLWGAGARLLGVDTLSPDPTVPPDRTVPADQPGLSVHEVFLGRDGVIVENLTGLAGLRRPDHDDPGATDRGASWSAPVWFGVFPLPVHEGDGAPARAVARPHPGSALVDGLA
ncbi:MAG: cyclase family protein [Micrococcus sp.]|nr:cyclase family protein [Micrococcus sp.]